MAFSIIFARSLPVQHILNEVIYQSGNHQYMFEFEILSHLLTSIGFSKVAIITESDFVDFYTEFPLRNDSVQTLIVKAVK